MTDVPLGDQRMEIPYRLIRSNRRTLMLTVDSEGALVARAPFWMAHSEELPPRWQLMILRSFFPKI